MDVRKGVALNSAYDLKLEASVGQVVYVVIIKNVVSSVLLETADNEVEQEELPDDHVWQMQNSEMVDDVDYAGTSDNEHDEEDLCNLDDPKDDD